MATPEAKKRAVSAEERSAAIAAFRLACGPPSKMAAVLAARKLACGPTVARKEVAAAAAGSSTDPSAEEEDKPKPAVGATNGEDKREPAGGVTKGAQKRTVSAEDRSAALAALKLARGPWVPRKKAAVAAGSSMEPAAKEEDKPKPAAAGLTKEEDKRESVEDHPTKEEDRSEDLHT